MLNRYIFFNRVPEACFTDVMEYLFYRRVLWVFIVFCGHLIYVVIDPGIALAQQTSTESFNVSSQTAAPDINVTETFTSPTENGTVDTLLPKVTTATTTVLSTATDSPSIQLEVTPECLCDLTPDFCDIGCCCDIVDCGVANLSTVFTGCPQKTISGVCLEKWLMFRANVDSSLVAITDSLFCVQLAGKSVPPAQATLHYPAMGDSHYFASPVPTTLPYTRDFYRVDDVILTYFSKTYARSLLRQPSPAVASALCTDHNPARFLRSLTLSCSRDVTLQSCTTDPTLNAQSYFADLNLIKHPVLENYPISDILIPVTPLSNYPTPGQQNNSCVNVVKKVEFLIEYTERGEISSAKVAIALTNAVLDKLLLQTHSVQFQLTTPSPAPSEPVPAVGLRLGSPVIGRYEDAVKPLTTIGVSQSGMCSYDLNRTSILFAHNSISGCTFISMFTNCSELRSLIYKTLRGLTVPEAVAMNSASQPDWTRVITKECLISPQESCDSSCMLPHTLSVRVLWARQGLLELPQNYILGVKYMFHCSTFKCPLTTPLALSSEVAFVDTTVYPEAPRGAPQPQWKFPFGFFTRGTDEVDGHNLSNSGGSQKITWILILFTMLLITGLLVL